MSDFDVEREAKALRRQIWVSRTSWDQMRLDILTLLTRCRDVTEEECIKVVDAVAIPHEQDMKGETSREKFYQKHIRSAWAQCKRECIAAIHERCRQREETK